MVFVDLHKQNVEPPSSSAFALKMEQISLFTKWSYLGSRQSDYTVWNNVEWNTAYPHGHAKRVYKIHADYRSCSPGDSPSWEDFLVLKVRGA